MKFAFSSRCEKASFTRCWILSVNMIRPSQAQPVGDNCNMHENGYLAHRCKFGPQKMVGVTVGPACPATKQLESRRILHPETLSHWIQTTTWRTNMGKHSKESKENRYVGSGAMHQTSRLPFSRGQAMQTKSVHWLRQRASKSASWGAAG